LSAPARTREPEALPAFLGNAPEIHRALYLAQRFARSSQAILVVGPSGSGKELLVQHIHAWSGRAGELVDVNCGALPRELVESVLFGSRRGSFSGSFEDRIGLIEHSGGGTLHLDEICSLPLEAQVKLLRVIDTSLVRRLGDTVNRRVDLRLVSASQERLGPRAAAGTFRLDLLQRVAGVVIELPSLAERRNDIIALAEFFALELSGVLGSDARDALWSHNWPGNVRELRRVIERASVLAGDQPLSALIIEEAIRLGAMTGAGEAPVSAEAERAALLVICEREDWHAGRIARKLGMGRTTLYRRLLDAGISLRQRKRVARLR